MDEEATMKRVKHLTKSDKGYWPRTVYKNFKPRKFALQKLLSAI